MRRFNAEVSQVVLWDDHEVRDNWYPTQRLDADARYRREERRAARGAREAGVPRVSAAAHQPGSRANGSTASGATAPALEIFALDMRSYRGPNSANRQTTLSGRRRVARHRAGRVARARAGGVDVDLEGDRLRHADRPRRPRRRRHVRGGGEPRRWRAARPRARDRAGCSVHQGSRRSATSSGSPRTSTTAPRITTIRRSARVHRVRSVLGIRRGPAARRHVRPRTRWMRRSDRR